MSENKSFKELKDSFDVIEIPPELDLTIEKAIQDGKKLKRKGYVYKTLASAACLALVIFSGGLLLKGTGLSEKDNDLREAGADNTKAVATTKALPTVGNLKNLQKLIADTFPNEFEYDGATIKSAAKSESMNGRAGAAADTTAQLNTDHSGTNNQVAGVDEADTIKTDGEYIYKIAGRTNQNDMQGVQIIKAVPGQNMTLVKNIEIPEFMPSQIFVNDKYLVVLGQLFKPAPLPAANNSEVKAGVMVDRAYYGISSTAAYIYDIRNKSNINRIRDIQVDGSLSAARMIGDNVYLVSNKYIYKTWLEGDVNKEILPSYKDSVIGKDPITLGYDMIKYCPEALEPNYIMVSSFDLNNVNQQVNVTCTLGSGRNVFCSADNLYVAGYNYRGDKQYNTTLYKFNLKNGGINFTGSGDVPGQILNQFSMDEWNNYFRVTTTKGNAGFDGSGTSTNNLYVLDSDMKTIGKIEDLAKGERIYSTRFMGDKAYMVTFKNTDPLFVLDLKNPRDPKALGELKIPGFSQYLHPYDENHIIGVGVDTVEDGNVAKRKGIKLAIFDVSDVNNPKQQFVTSIGDYGTYSDALYDHKAFLFSKEKNLLAFPVTVTEVKTDSKGVGIVNNTFTGAYVYNIDLVKGFTLKGTITHMTTMYPGSKEYDWNGRISRVLYIKDNLYTISDSTIKANNISNLKEVGSLKLK